MVYPSLGRRPLVGAPPPPPPPPPPALPATPGLRGPGAIPAAVPAAPPGAPADAWVRAAAAPVPRVFVFHGVDATGLKDHGRAGSEDLAARLRAAGYPEARALHYNSDSKLLNMLAIPREQLFGTFSRRLSRQILAELASRPLAPGQAISLVGYSLGCQVAARVATELARQGVPVATVALIEPKNGNTPAALSKLPPARKVLLVENQADLALENPHHVPLETFFAPHRSHLAMLEPAEPALVALLAAKLA